MHQPLTKVTASMLVCTSLLAVVVAVFALSGYTSSAKAAPSAQPEATIAALLTANAQLSTQVAQLAATAGAATPTLPAVATPQPTAQPSAPAQRGTPAPSAAAAAASQAPSLNTPGSGPLPFLIANVPLAPNAETLYDLRLDSASNRLYVTDTADQLHVLDATTYATIKTLPFGGWLELDSAHNRLYAYVPYQSSASKSIIHVVDTLSLEEIGQLEGSALAVDAGNQRLFVGDPYTYSTKPDAPGVRIYDSATLKPTGAFTQTGVPVYNPASNEVLIVAYTVYTANPDTQTITRDLFPELTDVGKTGFLWCNGCIWVDEVQYHPRTGVLEVDAQAHCTGKGCGSVQPSAFYDAATMARIPAAVAPESQVTCGSQTDVVGAVAGRRYRNLMYDRYITYTNFAVTDESGAPITQRDGLRTDFINPNTNQGYLYDGMVLDLETLAPLGNWNASCIFLYDQASGLLYGRRGGNLYVMAERGAPPPTPAAPVTEALPKTGIGQIVVSPNYAADQTLLLTSGDAIYRSTDGADSWMRLRGGLPEDEQTIWHLAISPNYAADKTIYLGGLRGDYWGDGMWRSQDGGDTWSATWNNLQHRRITDINFAPDFATSNTLVVKAKFYDVQNYVNGDSYQQSTDGGLNWTLVVTGNYNLNGVTVPLPPLSELLPGDAAQPPLTVRRSGSYGAPLQYTIDGTTWETATLPLDQLDNIHTLAPSPTYATDHTVYAFANLSLWRTTDGGVTWSRWVDDRLSKLDYKNQMLAGAVSPVLADGSYRLFAGTADGQVWVLDPAAMQWKSLAPVPPATPPASANAVAPTAAATAAATPAAETPAAAAAASLPTPTPAAAQTAATAAPAATGVLTTTAAPATSAAAHPLAGEPPQGLFRPEGLFAIVWENTPRIQADLGWARQAGPGSTSAAYQRFDNGVMVWRQDTGQIYAFFNDGTWQSFKDTFKEGDPESDPKFAPPPGKMQPIRGFGKVWRDHKNVRDKLGWALAKEAGETAPVQPFEYGSMLRVGGVIYTVVGVETDQGKWY